MSNKIRTILGPFLLMVCCPPIVMICWYINTALKGSLLAFWDKAVSEGLLNIVYKIWKPYFFGTFKAWLILIIFALIQLIFMKVLPGKKIKGPVSPKGNIPIYKANGVLAYLLSFFLFWFFTSVLSFFPATILYDHLGELLGALNFFSLVYCLFLYFKGKYAPSSTDHGTTGNFIFDYYWGTELYPRFFGWDLKMFTNCRFGMMGWGLLLFSYAAKQKELYGLSNSMLISIILQYIYLTKFYFWETGYLRSLDIMHDRAGFYICWGCLVWVPCIYTSSSMYLVHHPHQLSFPLTAFLLILGTSAILINYWADRQRYIFRQSSGRCSIWGKKPQFTVAYYNSTDGQLNKSVLLASGWWGIARHFHYLPEIVGALCWSLPALFFNFLPYFYVLFLTILLVNRAMRDDARCSKKYGKGWDMHCEKVRYRILPFLY